MLRGVVGRILRFYVPELNLVYTQLQQTPKKIVFSICFALMVAVKLQDGKICPGGAAAAALLLSYRMHYSSAQFTMTVTDNTFPMLRLILTSPYGPYRRVCKAIFLSKTLAARPHTATGNTLPCSDSLHVSELSIPYVTSSGHDTNIYLKPKFDKHSTDIHPKIGNGNR
jgi:hypothetical protein